MPSQLASTSITRNGIKPSLRQTSHSRARALVTGQSSRTHPSSGQRQKMPMPSYTAVPLRVPTSSCSLSPLVSVASSRMLVSDASRTATELLPRPSLRLTFGRRPRALRTTTGRNPSSPPCTTSETSSISPSTPPTRAMLTTRSLCLSPTKRPCSSVPRLRC